MDKRRPIRTKGFYKQVKVAESFLIILLALLQFANKKFSNKKECLDFYMNLDNLLITEDNCDQISRDK
jgi:hypothetical protein